MTNPSAQDLIKFYNLQPHPEGGYFSESYRSPENIAHSALPQRFCESRQFSTGIYFLLPAGKKSHLHKIKSDEMWHFYLGGPLVVVEISPIGAVKKTVMGHDIKNGQTLQHVVPHGVWFGAYPHTDSAYSFVGCTVAPGFDYTDFELGKRDQLLQQFPHAQDEIHLLTEG